MNALLEHLRAEVPDLSVFDFEGTAAEWQTRSAWVSGFGARLGAADGDEESAMARYWFLLYDGGGDEYRKTRLVAREVPDEESAWAGIPVPSVATRERSYDAYWTTTPATVDELFGLATEAHPALFSVAD